MNILITGATGFVGSNLIKRYINENHNLFCTLLEGEENPFGEEYVKSIVFAKMSIEEIVNFLKTNNIEGIIHLASFVQSGEHKPTDIEKLIDSNIKFGMILLESASQSNVDWFINTGTYWQNYNNKAYSPVNLYAATKEAFIDISKFYVEVNIIKFVTIKLFDTYGVGDNRPKIFNLWDRIAKSGETLDMSLGEQLIDISYIDDIVDCFILLANHLHRKDINIENGEVFAVKAEIRYSLKELAYIFEKVTKQDLNINWGSKPYRDREVMVPWENGKVVPGWEPKISIEMGIEKLISQ